MELNLIELTNRSDICGTYDVYKHCMYMPTLEKFYKKVDAFLNDDSIKIFACLYRNEIKGMIVVSFTKQYGIEIIGIAVDASVRCQGIGSYMVNKVAKDYSLISVYAETDDDAVGFYCKNGFVIRSFSEIYDGETFIRYKCELTK